MRIERAAVVVMASGSAVSTVILARSLWTLDLSLTYVVDHARAGVSGPYRLAGLWGGASGSLLMFTSMVAVAVAALVWTQQRSTAQSAAVWGSLTVAVLTGAVLMMANPFRRLVIPAISGAGMQPILEHPAMLYHPPLLYLGQVSTIVPFLIAVSAPLGLRQRRALRGWLGVSLGLMTVGLATGSNWAYVELGWGGYWGWDPVENGILVAWLLCLAALHALGQPGGGRAVRLLCALPWILVLVAAAVTRGGVGGSIHAFADDESVAWILLGLVVVTAAVAGADLLRCRLDGNGVGSDAGSERIGQQPDPLRRYRWLRIVCAALAVVAAALVLAGVLYPIPAPGEPLVTGRYYAPMLAPLAIVGLCAAAAAIGERTTVWSATGALIGVIAAATAGTRSLFALCTAAGVGVALANCALCVAVGMGSALANFAHRLLPLLGVRGQGQARGSALSNFVHWLLPRRGVRGQGQARGSALANFAHRLLLLWRCLLMRMGFDRLRRNSPSERSQGCGRSAVGTRAIMGSMHSPSERSQGSGRWSMRVGHIGLLVVSVVRAVVAGRGRWSMRVGHIGLLVVSVVRAVVAGRGRWSMRVGHIGFAVLLIGVAGSTQADRVTVGLEVGEEIHVGGRSFRHGGVEVIGGAVPGSDAVVATVEVHENDRLVATLHPALAAFRDRGVLLAETALHSRPSRDIQVVLRNAVDSGAALYDISVAPLIMWIWWGSVLIASSGIMVACDVVTGRVRRATGRGLRFRAAERGPIQV